LRTSSHLQLRPGQDKAKQCDTNNNTELHINKSTVNNTKERKIEKPMYFTVCASVEEAAKGSDVFGDEQYNIPAGARATGGCCYGNQ
jgi:uncharacterized protein (DUF169 family)